jgi:hypothetical protein
MKKALEKIDKIIYPHYNGTAVWYKKNRYDIVVGNVTYYIYDIEVIRLLGILMELNDIKQKGDES